MKNMSMFLFFLVGLINVLPLMGISSVSTLERMYAIRIESNDMALLLRHRASLFGIIGGFLLFSIWSPKFQIAAYIMAFVSMSAYLGLYLIIGDVNTSMRKVAYVDIAGIVLLVIAVVLRHVEPRS